MLNKLICLIVGHEKYFPNELGGYNLIELKGKRGCTLLTINVCKRCEKVYAEMGKD